MENISRKEYAELYGPTAGDKVRLGDTELLIEIEKDLTVYGNETSFNFLGSAANCTHSNKNYDLVIINVVIVDWSGIYKADIGIKDGKIARIGKSGDPNIQLGVDIEISSTTDIIDGKNLIITAGAIDTNAVFSDYEKILKSFNAGITTLIGGGQGTTDGTRMTGVSCGDYNISKMLKILDDVPVNVGLLAKGYPSGMEDAIKAGCMGIKLAPEWGLQNDAISASFSAADKYDVQVVASGTPTNERGSVEDFIASLGKNNICINDIGGTEGGFAPDNLNMLTCTNCFSSATTSALFYSKNVLDSSLDLLLHGKNLLPSDSTHLAIAESITRAETVVGQELLLDRGCIPIVTSSSLRDDSDLLIRHIWQLADKCKKTIGRDTAGLADNARVKRYLAKYTINPAKVYGLSAAIGSIEVGKIADLVLWQPAFFGVAPFMLIKSGIACTLNEQNRPDNYDLNTVFRHSFGNLPGFNKNKIIFASRESIEQGVMGNYDLASQIFPVSGARQIATADIYQASNPKIEVDPETYVVRADGIALHAEAASQVPLSRFYNMF
ncbi:urease subunit alpha [Serratia odorifera]|uniref:urease subunit alpha n=1 Tax=Serratia odorifera TaxID=618 RepID=UPI003531E756